MKTKEFIERLSALGYSTTKYRDTIEVVEMITPEHGRIHGRIHRKEPYRIETTQYTRQDPRVFDLMVEYSETPIEEREEEKKYLIHTTLMNYRDDCNMYLYKIKQDVPYHYDGRLHLIDNPYRSFTQSEIDNFPPEIKGAIECGFLKKVEVEE